MPAPKMMPEMNVCVRSRDLLYVALCRCRLQSCLEGLDHYRVGQVLTNTKSISVPIEKRRTSGSACGSAEIPCTVSALSCNILQFVHHIDMGTTDPVDLRRASCRCPTVRNRQSHLRHRSSHVVAAVLFCPDFCDGLFDLEWQHCAP